MILSLTTYDLLSVIVEGEVTVHTLRLGIVARGASDVIADEMLLSSLIELCDHGLIKWSVDMEYGQGQRSLIGTNTVISLLNDWQQCFGFSGPRGDCPDSCTINVGVTEAGMDLASRQVGSAYDQFLNEWFEWSLDMGEEKEKKSGKKRGHSDS